ncbi:hypothetical protein Tcan_01621 [Toxocara canis]|uniref:Uncharacterized protein n=1 Tax=Toxocara canis TaxID=6265 RepID=A0A0B2UIJ8_TOXCA|nr:hypothetical protein Tcan_01621 [Toxocara canis]
MTMILQNSFVPEKFIFFSIACKIVGIYKTSNSTPNRYANHVSNCSTSQLKILDQSHRQTYCEPHYFYIFLSTVEYFKNNYRNGHRKDRATKKKTANNNSSCKCRHNYHYFHSSFYYRSKERMVLITSCHRRVRFRVN